MGTDLAGKKCAIYARFSSAMQRESSIEDQVRRCRDYAIQHGAVVLNEHVFVDMAISGASLARPGFERLMEEATQKHRPFDVILTEDLSRVSRDFADAGQVYKRLQYAGVPLIAVSDGIDTSAKAAKLTFSLKAIVADYYLEDLRDKTLRGLEGRARAGYSTGGLPIGYRSEPVADPAGQVIGHRVLIDDEGAAIVRRIFSMYLDGYSHEAIAIAFNKEGVPPPRAHTRHRRKGWVASTIRAILHNRAYIGEWTYKRREWLKVPETNRRMYRDRPEHEVIRQSFPERRIIDQTTWDEVHLRLKRVHAHYVKGASKAGGNTGKRTSYPFSGLLFCGSCGSPMIIAGGSGPKYYRCGDNKKRGTCDNSLTIREPVVRDHLLGAFHDRLTSPQAVAHLRHRVAELLAQASRARTADIDERRQRLQRTEERIASLVRFIADGSDSVYVRDTLKDLEAQALQEKEAIAALERAAAEPIRLPSIDAIIARVHKLRELLEADPTRGREALKRYFADGRIILHPNARWYLARSEFLPVTLVLETTRPRNLASGPGSIVGDYSPPLGCAGRI